MAEFKHSATCATLMCLQGSYNLSNLSIKPAEQAAGVCGMLHTLCPAIENLWLDQNTVTTVLYLNPWQVRSTGLWLCRQGGWVGGWLFMASPRLMN